MANVTFGNLAAVVVPRQAQTIEVPDPYLYFQAPRGQVFRLVGIDEDLTKFERDVECDEQRNAELVAAARRAAEQFHE